MLFQWIKRYLPDSLYGRAALILILPVVSMQLVVSIMFIQRHFEGVTSQMTRNIVPEIRYLIRELDVQPDLPTAQAVAVDLGKALSLTVSMPADLNTSDKRGFFDLSGRVVIETLRARLPTVTGVDLVSDTRQVRVSLSTLNGGVELRVPRDQVSATNPHQLLVLMVATGVLMTLISILFLRNQIRPIRRLARAAEAFGMGRHTAYRPSGALEVRAAGAAFLDMRDRIERQIEQRTLMLSGISHDLRTPLTRLKLAISMQEETDDTEDMQRDVRDMERLIDEFLAFARGDALDDAVEVDVAALTAEVVANAVRGGQAVQIAHMDQTGLVLARPLAVTRALENLIGNAVRYGHRADVRVELLSGFVRIRVEDDGPGIPAEQRTNAIKPFARLDPSRNQNSGSGVGLGLAIASDIARKHGGSLQLGQSERLGGLRADILLAR
ncbi:ATP-binding protein [Pseudoruegeria sp. SK021]|uniref:ATP-binding protein n=1 Tax=Pseudoruegeria sp. SK021 TaxID=1933035 RepID=UPI000A25C08A|nr:ATP-binding protein [Pseudoruegeria sp. SK021]OSP53848.1 two-component sensor histidine kinase [Pseudoruegeria sp. SK021]